VSVVKCRGLSPGTTVWSRRHIYVTTLKIVICMAAWCANYSSPTKSSTERLYIRDVLFSIVLFPLREDQFIIFIFLFFIFNPTAWILSNRSHWQNWKTFLPGAGGYREYKFWKTYMCGWVLFQCIIFFLLSVSSCRSE